jgi:hypothetical protein
VKAGPSRSTIIGTVTMTARAAYTVPSAPVARTRPPDQSIRVTGVASATGRPSAKRAM